MIWRQEVGDVDHVEIDEADRADPRGGQIEVRGAAKAPVPMQRTLEALSLC